VLSLSETVIVPFAATATILPPQDALNETRARVLMPPSGPSEYYMLKLLNQMLVCVCVCVCFFCLISGGSGWRESPAEEMDHIS